MLEPVSVGLKFGFLAVLYLFLLWVAWSAHARPAARARRPARSPSARPYDRRDRHVRGRRRAWASSDDGSSRGCSSSAPPGIESGVAYDLAGRRYARPRRRRDPLEDPFASSRHARISRARPRAGDRGSGLDQRHLPQRGAAARARSRCTPATGSGSATASSPTSNDAMRTRTRCFAPPTRSGRPTPAASAGTTRTTRSRARRCSSSPTGWAARRPARSPPRSRSRRSTRACPDAGSPEERLADRVREANRRIYELSRTEHERAGMGTTLTAAYLDDDHAGGRARRRQPRLPVPRRRARRA